MQEYKSIAEINTGFAKHIDIPVKNKGDKPSKKQMKEIRRLIGKNGTQKWFNIEGLGFEENWMYSYGI